MGQRLILVVPVSPTVMFTIHAVMTLTGSDAVAKMCEINITKTKASATIVSLLTQITMVMIV